MNNMLVDIESRGKVAYNTGCIKTHAEAVAYAKKKYYAVLWQDTFVAGWNMAKWANN